MRTGPSTIIGKEHFAFIRKAMADRTGALRPLVDSRKPAFGYRKKLSTISYQLLAVLALSTLSHLPSARAQGPASEQTAIKRAASKRRVMTEPLEKYNTPPAYIYRLETGPRMISQFGVFTSFQVNVDASGNNILGDAANEPSITVDPTNHNRMAIGWRQFNSVQSDFRQGGWGFTTDAGTTWTFPGVLETNVFRSDPVLNSDETGNFFYLSLLQSFCENMYGSLDFGQTWTRLQPEGQAGGGDKQWFTIDKTGGTGHGFQYQIWSTAAGCDFSGQFSRSIDGGITWQPPVSIPSSPVWGTLDVDTDGNLFIGGGDFGSSFFCVRSSNAQNPAVTPTFDQNVSVNLGGSVLFGATINPGGLAGQIFLAVDRKIWPANPPGFIVAPNNTLPPRLTETF